MTYRDDAIETCQILAKCLTFGARGDADFDSISTRRIELAAAYMAGGLWQWAARMNPQHKPWMDLSTKAYQLVITGEPSTAEQVLDRLAEICDMRSENDQLREQLQLEREKVRQLSELLQHRIGHAIDPEIAAEPPGSEI